MLCPGCSQKIEPETILCPRCGMKETVSEPSRQVCDVFLMGFSDPSSYDQVIDFFMEGSFRGSRDELLSLISGLPAVVTKGMDAGRAHRLREALENRGGIVELRDRQMRDRGTAKKILREGDLEPETSPASTGIPARGGKGYLVLFLISLAAVVYLSYYHDFSQERKTVQRAVRKLTLHLPVPSPKGERQASSSVVAEEVSLSKDVDSEGISLNNEGVSAMDEGRYPEAVQAFMAALQLIPEEATILENLHRAWLQQGYLELEKKAYEKAVYFFEEAVKVSDQSPEAYKLMGMATLNLSDEMRAVDYLKTYLDRVPDDPEVARILGEIYYKQNRLEEAIHFLERYLETNPGDMRIKNIVEKAGRESEAEQGFDTYEGESFDVRYDGLENMEAGYLVVAMLNDAYRRIGAELNSYPSERMVAILYSDEDFRTVTQTRDWAKGLFDGKIRIPIGGLKEKNRALERVIAHEYTHALVHQMSGGHVPTWLNEGLAQYFEGEPGEVHRRNALHILRGRNAIPLSRLEGSFLDLDADTAALAYMESYTAVDLIIQQNGIYAIRKLLSELADGADMETALQTSVGMDYTDFQEEWLTYLARKYSS